MLHKKDPLKCLTCKSKCRFKIFHLSHFMRCLLLATLMQVPPRALCSVGTARLMGLLPVCCWLWANQPLLWPPIPLLHTGYSICCILQLTQGTTQPRPCIQVDVKQAPDACFLRTPNSVLIPQNQACIRMPPYQTLAIRSRSESRKAS